MTDLLRTLDDEPDMPSTVDIRAAILEARRRKRRSWVGAGVVLMTVAASMSGFFVMKPDEVAIPAIIVASPSVEPAPTVAACTISRLPVPDEEPMALVSGADPTGDWIVGRTYPESGGYQAVIWHGGTAEKVMLPGDLEESLQDVNSSGIAAGWSYTEAGPVPYAYRNGRIIRLGEAGEAVAINEKGRIAGHDDTSALVWESADAEPTELPVPAGTTTARASDVDLDGTVVGALDFATPYIWRPDGTHGTLPMPEIDGKPAAVAQAFSVRNGWVTGMASTTKLKGSRGAAKIYAARWNLRTGAVETVGGLQYPADAVNAYGWQTGTDRKGYAVLVTGEKTIRLPDLGKHRSDGTATIASTLSDDGTLIAGQSDDRSGTIQAVLWKCG
ncbi:hypothetical protein ACTI_53690 [Actinoplanes sp. OR16]|uniref:hypothetical protein n=1 Tax=Actinoplanes sp. OR16 TaxID=946334 RepID=UPI000F6BF072|nr:hypothetical protein [Actinoplanes sp. OR16]BBH68684.1 hypothetical protein ACTI_53690 [Actinoplanes sp. OR16]